MDEILEISSDSSDTIIIESNDKFLENSNNCDGNDVDIECIVNKYVSENCSTEDVTIKNSNQFSYEQPFSDDELIEIPLIKRLKKSPVKSINKPVISNFNEDNLSATETLQILSEKYNYLLENDFESAVVKDKSTVDEVQQLSDKEKKKREKESEKQRKLEERQRKKIEQEREKAVKKALVTAHKNLKPEECMRFICAYIDINIINEEYGQHILQDLQKADIKYKVQSQNVPNTISWARTIDSHQIDDDGKLITCSQNQDTDEILLIMNCEVFTQHVNNNTLSAHIQSLKSNLINKKITLAVFGLQDYFKNQKNMKNKEFRAQVSGDGQKSSKNKAFKDFPNLKRSDIEMALTELQLLCDCSHRMIDNIVDMALFVQQFTKAIAQTPYKLQKQEQSQQTAWYAAIDNRDCVKVDKDGNGLQRLWNQVLTTFPLAGLETASAISLKYSSPSALMEAYDNCNSLKEAELLLQDIPIRRAAGILSSARRIGPELSKKIFKFFTSIDGDDLL